MESGGIERVKGLLLSAFVFILFVLLFLFIADTITGVPHLLPLCPLSTQPQPPPSDHQHTVVYVMHICSLANHFTFLNSWGKTQVCLCDAGVTSEESYLGRKSRITREALALGISLP